MAIHLGGLSSGYDYQSMIDQLMEARKVPVTSKETTRSELDYDLGAWATVKTAAEDLTVSLDALRSYETWRNMSAESSDASVVSASVGTSSDEQAYSISVANIAYAQSIASDRLDTSQSLIAAGYGAEGDVFEIEGQQITIEAADTLSSLRTKINSAALLMDETVRVQASIVDSHLVITREKTGAGSINLSDVTGTALQGLGVLTDLGAVKNEKVAGDDARFTVNGVDVTRSENTGLTDVVEGMTISLNGAGTALLDVRPDREAVKAAVLDFVEKYNSLAAQIDEYSRIDMGGSSNLANKGELYGDSLLLTIKNNMRKLATAVKSPALNETNAAYNDNGKNGVMDSLSDVGIWTEGTENQLGIVDEELLDRMLENEFPLVEQMFKGTFNSTEVAYTNGVAADFYKYISRVSESMTGDIDKQIEALTARYDDLSDDIDEMTAALDVYEQDQWDNFTKMEDALAQMKQQLSYIESVFNSGGS
jgi:flagellar hook-associated protein 2